MKKATTPMTLTIRSDREATGYLQQLSLQQGGYWVYQAPAFAGVGDPVTATFHRFHCLARVPECYRERHQEYAYAGAIRSL